MPIRTAALRIAGAACLLGASSLLRAQAPSPGDTVAGWNALVDGLRALPARMLAKLPPDQRNDPQIRAEIGRLMLEALASSALAAVAGDGDHPEFVATIGADLNIGQPNADTIYRMAEITPGGTYRLRGRKGSDRLVKIGEVGAIAGPITIYHDLNALHADGAGRFDVILSPARPANYGGDWWQSSPATTRLLLRLVSDDWEGERDPTISIERLDGPVTRPRPPAAELTARLRRLPQAITSIATIFVGHVAELQAQGYTNRLKVFDVSKMGGLVGQFYYEGAYDLRDDEALIVAAKVPAKCLYRSILLTNEIYETTDWLNNESSLNDGQAKPDKDGVLRIVVAARDPGVANWLDTAGYPRGAVQGRWTGCSSQPIPDVRKVKLADIGADLPPETAHVAPAARATLIRDRRAAYQQRPLW